VVIDNLDIFGTTISPVEANTPLVVDSDAEGATPRAVQSLKSVARRHAKINQSLGNLKLPQLATGYSINICKA